MSMAYEWFLQHIQERKEVAKANEPFWYDFVLGLFQDNDWTYCLSIKYMDPNAVSFFEFIDGNGFFVEYDYKESGVIVVKVSQPSEFPWSD